MSDSRCIISIIFLLQLTIHGGFDWISLEFAPSQCIFQQVCEFIRSYSVGSRWSENHYSQIDVPSSPKSLSCSHYSFPSPTCETLFTLPRFLHSYLSGIHTRKRVCYSRICRDSFGYVYCCHPATACCLIVFSAVMSSIVSGITSVPRIQNCWQL